MYEKRGTVYAEAGRLLRSVATGAVMYCAKGVASDYTEIEAPADDLTVADGMAKWGGGLCAMALSRQPEHGRIKRALIKLRYSNDDQLAVMLNGDEQEMERMQAWRAWAADVAARIEEQTQE